MFVGEGVELVNEPFCVHPAKGVQADIELTGVVADDHGVGQEAVSFDAAPQCAFGGNQHRVRIDLEGKDVELLEMRVPSRLIGEGSIGMLEKASDHKAGQRPLAHIS